MASKTNKSNPRIAVIGGGTGLSTLLRGLKAYTGNLTAIVAVTDDGGSSGMLRKEMGVLPPGDIRNCLVALSEEESAMAQLFTYRFPSVRSLSGHSFGNLFITAMGALSGGFDKGVERASKVLAIRGRVLPVTLSSVNLQATLEDGRKIKGETKISRATARIKRLSIVPKPPPAAPTVIDAIKKADAIVIGPGSLYTSVIANLLIWGVARAVGSSRAPKIYVCNVMTQPGETSGYSLSDHVKAIESHCGRGILDYCLVNSGSIPKSLSLKYADKDSFPVKIDKENLSGIKVMRADMVSDKEFARHDPAKLAAAVMKTLKI
jgi:uncharacterized cofD-like protein